MRRIHRRKQTYKRKNIGICGDKRRFFLCAGIICLAVLAVFLGIWKLVKPRFFPGREYSELSDAEITAEKPEFKVDLLDVNENSRPGIETQKITGIVIHYTANPGSTAQDNRDYFQSLKDSGANQVSSNFVVGIEGEIVQCVPTWEVAYASNERNIDTVSIECCHPDKSGKFTKETYKSMVQLTAWLCRKFELSEEDVIRHYDVTGKNCPKYFVENEGAWQEFKQDIRRALEKSEKE